MLNSYYHTRQNLSTIKRINLKNGEREWRGSTAGDFYYSSSTTIILLSSICRFRSAGPAAESPVWRLSTISKHSSHMASEANGSEDSSKQAPPSFTRSREKFPTVSFRIQFTTTPPLPLLYAQPMKSTSEQVIGGIAPHAIKQFLGDVALDVDHNSAARKPIP